MKKFSFLLLIMIVTFTTLCTKEVKIKDFPIAMQCWTFNKYSFLQTLEKAQSLGIRYLEAYPGQILDSAQCDIKFDHALNHEQIERVKQKLNEHGLQLVSYGVVEFDNTEAGMRAVFDFAKTMGIKTICTEPAFDDFSLIEKMVREYDIRIAIHNHPVPSKYAYPDTVLRHVNGLDARIGACADTGHWLRTGVEPIAALRLLTGRITNVHLKDLDAFGVKDARDVPFGSGKANIHDVLLELTRQNYDGYLSIEHENQDEIYHPEPSIQKGLEYIRSIVGER
ncbi:MAG: sugar phosphate isomerase/epimerase family protein [Candidatus Zhuqueibacterota bacterium]